jgi:hypothetical protein
LFSSQWILYIWFRPLLVEDYKKLIFPFIYWHLFS